MLVYMHSFKTFEVTAVNQEFLTLTHGMKGCTIMQISSTSDPNIAKVQPSFLLFIDLIKSIIKFLAYVIFFDYSR